MTTLKQWFSSTQAQQNTIDIILDELKGLKLDEAPTTHEHVNPFTRLVDSLKTLEEEFSPQVARNLFLNNIVDPDYENIRTTLKSTKKGATY